MNITLALSALLLSTLLQAESIDESLEGFDDTPSTTQSNTENVMDGFDDIPASPSPSGTSAAPEMDGFDDENMPTTASDNNSSVITGESSKERNEYLVGFSGKLVQQVALGYDKTTPQNIFSSLRQSLYLDYERKYENGLKIKINGRGFYDGIYDISVGSYYPDEIDELRTEVELFEAYFEWTASENLDVKLGRQYVVWGRSDTIRITDILNSLDNRRPGFSDIEDLRLPVTMLKFDYKIQDWTVTPIAILEQRFSKYPSFGSVYFPIIDGYTLPVDYRDYQALGIPLYHYDDESYSDVNFALSVERNFEGWDISLYAARVYQDLGFIDKAQRDNVDPTAKDVYFHLQHNKTNMFGTALNFLTGEWLFKSELAYFSDLTYTSTWDRTLSRTDALLGVEYSGISNTTLSYDFSIRHFNQYDERLYVPLENYLERDTYQQALRVSSDFVNDTIHVNYLLSVFGKKMDKGGFQRLWMDYDVADAINAKVGIIDYLGGSPLFERVKDKNVLFMDMSYSF